MKYVVMLIVLVALSISQTIADTYFKEDFSNGLTNWEQSKADTGKKLGSFKIGTGDVYGHAKADMGAMTGEDARFYAMSRQLDKVGNADNHTMTNEDKDLVIQFSLRWPKNMDCGGGYLKVFREGIDQKTLSGDTDYAIMFGPDVCGSTTKKVHVIFNYKGKNLSCKRDISAPKDRLTHVFTLIVRPNDTYEVRIDGEMKVDGNLLDDWDFVAPKMIKNPDAVKPEDWDDRLMINDPNDVKPDGFDDIPAEIADPEAQIPEDWDVDADGKWEAPKVPNPEFQGEWEPKTIENPMYKGKWEADIIANPDYVEVTQPYLQKDLMYVGFELWQVKSGSVFDNIIITDSVEEAEELLENTYMKSRDLEKAMVEELEQKVREDTQAARKIQEEKNKENPSEDEEFDDEDDIDKDEL